MNRRSKAILLSGVILLIATAALLLLCINDWSGLTKLASSTILWSEIAFFGGLLFVERVAQKTEQVITRSSVYFLLSAYAVINILVSIVYITFFKQSFTSFLVFQIVLFAVVAIAILIFLTASRSIYKANAQTNQTVAGVQAMVDRLNELALNPEYDHFSSTLKKLSEDLRFTDLSTNAPEDAEILDAISAIEIELGHLNENTGETVKSTLVRLNSLINQRKVSTGAIKKGRI